MAERDLIVRIIGDDKDLKRAFASSEKASKTFGGQISGVGVGISRNFVAAGVAAGATAVGFQTVTAAIGASVAEASNLTEQIAKNEQVFGSFADTIEDWSETTARSIGISQTAALDAAGAFGLMFTTLGLGQEDSAQMSRTLVQLAADMASFSNQSPEEMLERLRSGLAGEVEPLRRFGVDLSAAVVSQRALDDSGKKNVQTLTQQEKIQARYNLILEQTVTQQGDVARTHGSLANQSRQLNAQLDDLSADIGGVLIPILTDAAAAANTLFVAFEKIQGIEFDFPGLDFDLPGAGGFLLPQPIGPLIEALGLIGKQDEDAAKQLDEALSPGRAIGEDIARKSEERARAIERGAREAKRSADRARAAFQEFTRGMGLKLDKAQLTDPLTDDIAVLRELERAILRQIEREGRTFKLVDQLTQVRLQISSLVEQSAADAAQKSADAFANVIGFLELDLDRALASASFEDDLRALDAIERALVERIAAEGRTLELEQQLLDVRQQQDDVRREQNERQRERRQERQFEGLGLTAEGQERTPGVGALRRRLGTLRDQLKGTTLDTEETRSQLQRIARVLSGEFGAVGKEVRAAILQMFKDISGALEEGGKEPLTKAEGLNTKKILAGLGLSPQEQRALRGRLSSVTSGGLTLPGAGTTTTGGGFGGGQPFVVESHTTIELNGDVVARAVTRSQQRQRRRNPRQKRGANRNR